MFNYDSGIMRTLSKITDIVILNLLTLICCIPIITIGTAITAAHYAALKLHRDRGYVAKNFFRSFKMNLGQGILIWLIWLAMVGLTLFSFSAYGGNNLGSVLKGVMLAMLIFIAMISMWLFPLQARFSNPIRATIRNAFYLSCKHLIRTIGMLIVVTLCALLWFVGARLFWIPLLVGISLPIYLCVLIYDKVFEKLEDTIKEAQKEEVEEGEPASVGEAEIPEVALEQIAEQNAGQDVEEISE